MRERAEPRATVRAHRGLRPLDDLASSLELWENEPLFCRTGPVLPPPPGALENAWDSAPRRRSRATCRTSLRSTCPTSST